LLTYPVRSCRYAKRCRRVPATTTLSLRDRDGVKQRHTYDLYDDDEYQSANAFKYEAHGNVSGWIATHNKQVAHLTIVQERRMPRTCEIDHASLVPLCYDSFDVRKFTPKPLDKFVEIAPFFPPGMNQSELDATGLAHAFVCTDTAGLLCDKSDPLDEFFDGKDLGEKPVSARNTGYKLDVDLGIFRSGLATSKQRIADARALLV